MVSVFDLEKLRNLLKDFYMLTKMRIVVYDGEYRELCAYPENRARICRMIRRNLQVDEACMRCDREACLVASRMAEPYIYPCHIGLAEAISPLRVNSVIVGYLSFGHLFAYPSYEAGWEIVRSRILQYGIDPAGLEEACRELPLCSREYVLSAAHILDAVASYLVLQRMAVLTHDSIEMQLDRYLAQHFTEDILIPELCSQFGIGKTTLSKIAKKCYGCGIQEHIRNLRMEKAKQMLREEPELSVAEIAQSCGYDDYNYFITVFSRTVGVPPRQYQRSHRKG